MGSGLRSFYLFFKSIYDSRAILITLAIKDFRQQYLGSYLGLVWAFIQPAVMILVMWFVFQVGFKAQPVSDVPFILWLATGMVPWLFFADSVSNGTSSIVQHSYLVKKVVFRVAVLPIIKIISSLFVHLFFILFLVTMYVYYGYPPSIYWIQLPYYLLCMIVLALGINWLTSSIMVFIKDTGQFVALLLQLGFWFTPIFWTFSMIPEKYLYLIKLNPMFYIVDGYRNTFIEHKWFWETYKITPYFLISTSIILIVGAIVFKKLRPHFADVL